MKKNKWKCAEKINEKNIRKFKMKIAGERHNKMKILDYFDGFSTMKKHGHPFWAGEIDKKNFWEGVDMVSYMGFATPLQRDVITANEMS